MLKPSVPPNAGVLVEAEESLPEELVVREHERELTKNAVPGDPLRERAVESGNAGLLVSDEGVLLLKLFLRGNGDRGELGFLLCKLELPRLHLPMRGHEQQSDQGGGGDQPGERAARHGRWNRRAGPALLVARQKVNRAHGPSPRFRVRLRLRASRPARRL